jgi:hypothetical protein
MTTRPTAAVATTAEVAAECTKGRARGSPCPCPHLEGEHVQEGRVRKCDIVSIRVAVTPMPSTTSML